LPIISTAIFAEQDAGVNRYSLPPRNICPGMKRPGRSADRPWAIGRAGICDSIRTATAARPCACLRCQGPGISAGGPVDVAHRLADLDVMACAERFGRIREGAERFVPQFADAFPAAAMEHETADFQRVARTEFSD